jgi:hypothetical protein
MAAQPIAINHSSVAMPVRTSQAHGHMAERLCKSASSAGNFGSMFTEFDTTVGTAFFRGVHPTETARAWWEIPFCRRGSIEAT